MSGCVLGPVDKANQYLHVFLSFVFPRDCRRREMFVAEDDLPDDMVPIAKILGPARRLAQDRRFVFLDLEGLALVGPRESGDGKRVDELERVGLGDVGVVLGLVVLRGSQEPVVDGLQNVLVEHRVVWGRSARARFGRRAAGLTSEGGLGLAGGGEHGEGLVVVLGADAVVGEEMLDPAQPVAAQDQRVLPAEHAVDGGAGLGLARVHGSVKNSLALPPCLSLSDPCPSLRF